MLPAALQAWGARRLCYEWDGEPYAQARDATAREQAQALGCAVFDSVSHTLYDPRAVISANKGAPPLTYAVRSTSSACG